MVLGATKQKRARVLCFAQGNRLEQRGELKVPSPPASSMPPSADAKLVAAAEFKVAPATFGESGKSVKRCHVGHAHRTHHSAFSKPEIEHLVFSCLNPKHVQDSADSCSHS
jgi:hypothetical protein